MGNIIKSVKGLDVEELKSFGNALGKELSETGTSEVLGSLVDSMPSEDLNKAVNDLSEEKKREIHKSIAFSPSNR
ncbi:hypothetical protein [Sulfurovum sp.]|uniref:hypothetical protein n=1 Tax=Sulfurovum sp. TaxID=1969726 RepID=UPI0025F735F3|nr:hypothetical protein [Sulfurovum sp.]